MTKFIEARPYSDPDAAARKLIEVAYSIERVQDAVFTLRRSTGPSYTAATAHPPNMAVELTTPL